MEIAISTVSLLSRFGGRITMQGIAVCLNQASPYWTAVSLVTQAKCIIGHKYRYKSREVKDKSREVKDKNREVKYKLLLRRK